MRSKILKFTAIALFSLVGIVFAENSCCEQKEPECGICKDEAVKLPEAYNAPARIDVKGCWDFSIDASFIYWQPREVGLEYVYVCPDDDARDVLTGYLADLDYKYKPGFKVGLRYGSSHDEWVTDVHYTWFHCKLHDEVSIDPEISPGYFLEGLWILDYRYNHSPKISADWNFKLDLLDLNISRPCYRGKKFVATPFFGVKGGWIRQHYIVTDFVDKDNILISTNKSRSWLIGPRIGIVGDWLIGAGFRFFGNGAATLYYQQMEAVVISPEIDHPELVQVYVREALGQITPACELGTGLGWGCYFCKNKWHFDLTASYDFNYFFGQNAMKTLNDDVFNSTYKAPGSLVLHGLTVTARLDF